MGGLRDDLNKLPAIRPSPVGQENIPATNPPSCPSMNYPTNRNQQTYSQPTTDLGYSHQQQIPYYPSTDQHSAHSGSASLSSSSTSLNNDYYTQGASYGMLSGNQGYVNPMYQAPAHQLYQDNSSTGYTQVDASTMSQNNYANNYQQPAAAAPAMNQYGNYTGNYQQQATPQLQQQTTPQKQQYDYYKSPTPPIQKRAPTPQNVTQRVNQNFNYNQAYPQAVEPKAMYQNQYQPAYPVAQSPVHQQQQQYPVVSQYSGVQQFQPSQQYQSPPQPLAVQSQPTVQSQTPMPIPQSPLPSQSSEQQYSVAYAQQQVMNQQQQTVSQQPAINQQLPASQPQSIIAQQQPATSQQHTMNQQQPVSQQQLAPNQQQETFAATLNQSTGNQDYVNQQNYYNYNTSPQQFMSNQYGQYEQQFIQQNYSCFTPTVNSMNSYMTAGDSLSQTTQSSSYNQVHEIVGHAQANSSHQPVVTSPQHQPYAIPTNTAATNASSLNHSETHSTNSQQQITSPMEKQAPVAPVKEAPKPAPVKSENMDLLSGIDFTMASPMIDNIPTLTPVSIKAVEESPKKIIQPEPVVVASPPAPVKLNDDLADLDFNSLTTSMSSPVKVVEPEKPQKLEDPFNAPNVVKQFHKEVESLEKFMETLTVKTLNGVTPLANKWKELQDLLVKDESKRSVSVARLFPDKNRSIDCLPYDHARVHLATATDNYINAVHVKDSGPIGFILAQTPMVNTVNDYWEMVVAEKSNTLVCLHSPSEVKDDEMM